MLNFSLMSRWENWVTILLMVVLGSFAFNEFGKIIFASEME